MEKDGTMSSTAGAYAGQDRFDCRDNLWADMETAVSLGQKEAKQVPRMTRKTETEIGFSKRSRNCCFLLKIYLSPGFRVSVASPRLIADEEPAPV